MLGLLVGLGQEAAAQEGNFELGVLLGEPTGLSIKLWASDISAFDLAAAWSFEKRFHVHADYLLHTRKLISVPSGRLPLYTGFGGVIATAADLNLAFRIPLGSTYLFESIPLSLFLEAAPKLYVSPDVEFGAEGGLGARYMF
jgi:hypothetical protein